MPILEIMILTFLEDVLWFYREYAKRKEEKRSLVMMGRERRGKNWSNRKEETGGTGGREEGEVRRQWSGQEEIVQSTNKMEILDLEKDQTELNVMNLKSRKASNTDVFPHNSYGVMCLHKNKYAYEFKN